MMRGDDLVVRAWLAEANELRRDWSLEPAPDGLSQDELAVAAGFVELMAERAKLPPPAWTHEVGAASGPVFLVPSARTMPRTRRVCETAGPLPFRRRGVLALPGCYTTA
jgi:hypothetical protein